MASASSLAEEDLVDPQLQKSTVEEESAGNAPQMTTETETKKKKKKKKILREEPEWYVKQVLSYKPEPLEEPEVPEFIIRNDPVLAANLYVMFANTALYDEYKKDEMLEKQRNFRQQLKTQSKVTREIEIDEDDDRYETAGGSAGGKGRRRHRPGVMKKQDGNTRKLN
uniref:Uncharacterized protein n=1 Tax=Avena sativa TaxID=4498 RepID=A0ACD5UQ21_AVESA